MVVLIVFTVLWHLFLNSGYQPLFKYLPLSLAERIERVQGTPTIGSGVTPSATREKDSQIEPSYGAEKSEQYPPRASYEDYNGVKAGNTTIPNQVNGTGHGAVNGAGNGNHGAVGGTTNGHGAKRDVALDMQRSGSVDDTEPTAFNHPATYEPQRVIWIPQDRHNLYKDEVAATRSAKVDVSSDGAEMNEKGKVDVWRSPPDEEWDESQDI